MDDSSLMNPKTKVRKSSFDINENQKHQKRNSLALRSIIPKNLGHSPSLGLEFSNKNDIFMFKNNVSHLRNSIIKSVLSNQNEKNPIEELEGEKELINGNFSYSFDYNQKSKSNIIDSKMLFSIPKEPMEHEGIIKANEQSSESDISGLSSKICCEKGVQANMENESCFEKIQDINKNDIFLQDFEMHNDKKNNPQTEKNQVKKTSIKINSKFFLIGDDSDDSQIFKKGKLEKSNNESIMNVIKSKSEKQSFVDKNSRKFYLDEIENKISGLSNLINDFLRNFKEKKQTGEVFNASKKNKFLKIHHSLNDLMKKLNFDHYVMKHELLKKTMIKLDEETLKTLNYHKLMTLIFEGYSRLNEGFIEYNLNLNDGIMKKVWKFQIRYSKLRNFHKECKSFLNSIKLDDTFIGSLPPFPQKKWFGNTEDEFLKTRQHELEGYFKTIMTSPLCVQIIEKGILRYFLYKEIWKQESEDIKRKCEHIEKWDVMTKKSLISSKNVNNEEEILNYETLGMQMKEEIQKIYSKLEEMKIDLDLLEKNDSFTIIRYEEKRKKLEKELSAQDSLNEIDFKGLLP